MVAIVKKKKRKEKTKRKSNRVSWVKPWLQRRSTLGATTTLIKEFENEDQVQYAKFLRMSPEIFYELLRQNSSLYTETT